MLNWIDKGLGAMLSFFSIGGSYAVGLLFYALVFKLVFVFFAIKQQKNQIAKYRGRTDQVSMRKKNEEIMKLQQEEGYSPLAGCLPMLIQMPIIILLYRVIRKPLSAIAGISTGVIDFFKNHFGMETLDEITLASKIKHMDFAAEGVSSSLSIEMNTAGLGEWNLASFEALQDSIPNFDLFGLDLSLTPKIAMGWFILIPILVGAFQWLSMFIMRKVNRNPIQDTQGEQAQMSFKIMDIVMPAMTLGFAFGLPAVMGVYWIYQSILGTIQSVIIAKVMPVPKYTEEELKIMEKARRQQEKAQSEIMKAQPKYKSLHYIDEEDYEELPEVKSNNPKNTKSSSTDKPEIKD